MLDDKKEIFLLSIVSYFDIGHENIAKNNLRHINIHRTIVTCDITIILSKLNSAVQVNYMVFWLCAD